MDEPGEKFALDTSSQELSTYSIFGNSSVIQDCVVDVHDKLLPGDVI